MYVDFKIRFTTGPEETTIFTIPTSTPYLPTLDSSSSFTPSILTSSHNITMTSPIPSTSDTDTTLSGIDTSYFKYFSFWPWNYQRVNSFWENLHGSMVGIVLTVHLNLTPGEMGLIPHLLSSVNPPTASPSSLAPGQTTPPTGPTGEIPHLLGSSK